MDPLGQHLLLEFYGCPDGRLDDVVGVEAAMVEAAGAMGAHVVGAHFHRFEPHGVSGVVVISESHLTIHTWPEYGYAAVDVFTCGAQVDPPAAVEALEAAFEPTDVQRAELSRGRLPVAGRQGRRPDLEDLE